MTASILVLLALAATPAEVEAAIEAQRLDEAEAALAALPENLRPRFRGRIALAREAFGPAATHFEAALEAEGSQPELHLYLGHCLLLLERAQSALHHVQSARTLGETLVAQPLLEAQALQMLERVDEAYAVLAAATERFSGEVRPRLELVALLQGQGLDRAAREAAAPLVEQPLDRSLALALIHLLYRDPLAKGLVEAVAVHFEGDAEMKAHVAHAYAAADEHHAAGRLFEAATDLGGDYAFEAADQYRVGQDYRAALRANARVLDPERKRRQRLSILFDAGRYAHVLALGRDGDAPADVYRLAYAHYALGHYDRAREQARKLPGTTYAAAGQALLKAMSSGAGTP